jgi:hypothetical protein
MFFDSAEDLKMPHVTFIHGIANKPPRENLQLIWENAIARDGGIDLNDSGVTTNMVYWADCLYGEPQAEGAYENAANLAGPDVAVSPQDTVDQSWRQNLPGDEKAMVDQLAAKLKFEMMVDDAVIETEAEIGIDYERIPLPGWLKQRMMAAFLRDVHHYLYNVQFSPRPGVTYQLQDEIRMRLVAALQEGAGRPGPHVLISHSMGTVISYDCLKRVPDCPPVDALITIGSPLGLDEVQDPLKPELTSHDGFPGARLKGPWINVYDSLDPVAGLDPDIANDYKRNGEKVIEDINEQNWGKWRHDITKYLAGQKLRGKLKELLQL